jgi:hypothetical protein
MVHRLVLRKYAFGDGVSLEVLQQHVPKVLQQMKHGVATVVVTLVVYITPSLMFLFTKNIK